MVIATLLYIHFIAKEKSYLHSLNFYTFPLPIIIGIILFFSIFLKVKKYNFIVAGLLLVFWLFGSFKIHIPEKINDTDIEIVFWNASRSNGFNEAFDINGTVPDILVLTESGYNNLDTLKLKYPNIYFYKIAKEIYISSKTEIEVESTIISNYKTTIVPFKTPDVQFYAVDVTGSTDVPREWELTFVDSVVKQRKNTVILGDFNVPYESKYLKPFKTDFKHAFNEKGIGFRETWFYNLPLLSLDHIWVSKNFKVLKTNKTNTFKSDHNLLSTFIRKI